MRGILVAAAVAACGAQPPREEPPAEKPPPVAEPISLVTSMVIVDACPDSKRLDTKQTTRELEELVGPCKKVPGGEAHFAAILVPGGHVELTAPDGNPDEGIIPTCLVQSASQLKHKIKLTSPCKFDVKLEQRLGPR